MQNILNDDRGICQSWMSVKLVLGEGKKKGLACIERKVKIKVSLMF